MDKSRRSVLAMGGASVVLISGCSGSEDVPDLAIRNETDEELSYTAGILKQSDESSVFSDEGTLNAGDSVSYDNPVEEAGDYIIEATAGDRADTWDWYFEDDSKGVELVFDTDTWTLAETGGSSSSYRMG